MSCTPPFFNSQIVDELEEEVVLLNALLSCATGVWYSHEEDIPSAKSELMEGMKNGTGSD